jgi:hypothetical protein
MPLTTISAWLSLVTRAATMWLPRLSTREGRPSTFDAFMK